MQMGFEGYIYYSSLLVLIHHVAFFMLDTFGFDHFLKTLGQIVLTTLVTELFVVFSQYIAFRK